MGISLVNLANVHIELGEFAKAQTYLAEAHSIYARIGNRAGVADVTRSHAYLAFKQGDYGRMFDQWVDALAVFEELGDKAVALSGIEGIAFALNGLGYPARAARLLSAAAALRRTLAVQRLLSFQPTYDAIVAGVRGQLSADAFAAAWVKGGALTFKQAVDDALERPAVPLAP